MSLGSSNIYQKGTDTVVIKPTSIMSFISETETPVISTISKKTLTTSAMPMSKFELDDSLIIEVPPPY